MKAPLIDTWAVEEYLAAFIRRKLRGAGLEKVVVGLSGGIDSSTSAGLAAHALGSANVLGLILPFGDRRPHDAADAQEVADLFRIHTRVIDISPMLKAYFEHFPHADAMRRGNKMARERMSILYDWASYHQALVLGTGNRTEIQLGYLTKFGDGGVDLEPLGGLYKCEVRQLAGSLGIPSRLVNRVPSAGFWPGQTDEDELGLSYDLIDGILHHMLDLRRSKLELVKLGYPAHAIEIVEERMRRSRHKRLPPSIPPIREEWRKTPR